MSASRRFSLVNRVAPVMALALVAASCGAKTPQPVTTYAAPLPGRATATHAPAYSATATPRKVLTNTPQAAASPTVQASALGQALGMKEVVGRLAITPTKAEAVPSVGAQSPKAGDVYWVVNLTLGDADSKASAAFDPANAVVVDPSTSVTYAAVSIPSVADQLRSQSIAAGGQSQGVLIFELPQKVAHPELEFLGGSASTPMWALRS